MFKEKIEVIDEADKTSKVEKWDLNTNSEQDILDLEYEQLPFLGSYFLNKLNSKRWWKHVLPTTHTISKN